MLDRYDYLIIGGGVAGTTAAETIRENDGRSTIGIISEEPHPFYSRVLLPAYLKGQVPREKLFLRRAEDLADKKIDLNLGERVFFVDVRRKEVGLLNHSSVGFEKLLLATGGSPVRWGEEGAKDFIFRLQTIDDADRLKKSLGEMKKPLVVGASFISLEFLEIFTIQGLTPEILVRGPYFMDKILDERGGEILRENFERRGIKVQTNDSIQEVNPLRGELSVLTEGLRTVSCDAIALGIGLERNISFLTGSGIQLGDKGVLVNEFLETNMEGIFAAGDVAEFYDVVLGKQRIGGNWTNAFLQGKIAGRNMAGGREILRVVSAYSITNLGFQITALGDQSETEETIVRCDTQKNRYERFFLKGGVIVGASLINQFQDKAQLAKLVETKTPVVDYRDRLSDWGFDIHEIPVIQ